MLPIVLAEMRERYHSGSEDISCKAVHANFRRFQVKTDEEIKGPKKQDVAVSPQNPTVSPA